MLCNLKRTVKVVVQDQLLLENGESGQVIATKWYIVLCITVHLHLHTYEIGRLFAENN